MMMMMLLTMTSVLYCPTKLGIYMPNFDMFFLSSISSLITKMSKNDHRWTYIELPKSLSWTYPYLGQSLLIIFFVYSAAVNCKSK